MFRVHVLIVRRAKLYYTVSGIITPIGGRPVHRTATYTTYTMKTIKKCINPSYVQLGTVLRWVYRFMLFLSYPLKNILYDTHWMGSWLNLVGRLATLYGSIASPYRERNLGSWVVQPPTDSLPAPQRAFRPCLLLRVLLVAGNREYCRCIWRWPSYSQIWASQIWRRCTSLYDVYRRRLFPGFNRVSCWSCFNVSANISVAIFRVNEVERAVNRYGLWSSLWGLRVEMWKLVLCSGGGESCY